MARLAVGAALLAGLLAPIAAGCGGGDKASSADLSFAAVIKGLDNPFFVTMRQGLEQRARDRRIALSIRTAGDLYDTAGQASRLEAAVSEGADCYIVNPITRANLVEPLSHVDGGTPIVNLDSPVDQVAAKAVGVEIATYIGTDNTAGGSLGADAMTRAVPAGAQVVLVTGVPGDATSAARARGFRAGNRGRFRIVDSVAADFERRRAELTAAELLRTDPGIDGFFAVNDEMALGIVDALRRADRTGEVAVVGFDGIRPALAAVKRGSLTATVSQYPYAMGRQAVDACLAAVRGNSLPADVAAPAQVVTRANVARALAKFPHPVEPFHDPLSELLED